MCAHTADPHNTGIRLKDRWAILHDFFTNYPTTLESWEMQNKLHLIRTDHLKEELWKDIIGRLDFLLNDEEYPQYLLSSSPNLFKLFEMVENLADALKPKLEVNQILNDWEALKIDIKQIQNSFLLSIWIWSWEIKFQQIGLIGVQNKDYELKILKHKFKRLTQRKPTVDIEGEIHPIRIGKISKKIKELEDDIGEFGRFGNPSNRPPRTWLNLFLLYTEHFIKRKKGRERWNDITNLFSHVFKGDPEAKINAKEFFGEEQFRKLLKYLQAKRWDERLLPRRKESFLDEPFCDDVLRLTLSKKYYALLNSPGPHQKKKFTMEDIEDIKDHLIPHHRLAKPKK